MKSLRFRPIAVLSFFVLLVISACALAQKPLELILPVQTEVGPVQVGQCDTFNLEVRNLGQDTLFVTATCTNVGSDSSAFRVIQQPTVFPQSFGKIQIQFCPMIAGIDTMILSIPFCDLTGISFRGYAVSSYLTVSPDTMVDLGTFRDSGVIVLSLHNVGTADLICYSFQCNDTGVVITPVAGMDSTSMNCTKKDPIGADVTQTVRFVWQWIGTPMQECDTASISIISNNGLAAHTLYFAGCHENLSLQNFTSQFKRIAVNSTDTQPVVLKSTVAEVRIDSIAIAGPSAHAFSWSSYQPYEMTFPYLLQPGDSIIINWMFAPQPSDTGDMSGAALIAYTPTADTVSYATGAAGTASHEAVSNRDMAIPVPQLFQTIPNPVVDFARLAFVSGGGNVELHISNALGVDVYHKHFEELSAGVHDVLFDAHDLPAGSYWYVLSSGAYHVVRNMIVVR